MEALSSDRNWYGVGKMLQQVRQTWKLQPAELHDALLHASIAVPQNPSHARVCELALGALWVGRPDAASAKAEVHKGAERNPEMLPTRRCLFWSVVNEGCWSASHVG